MSALSAFLKKNKKTKDNVKYAVTKSLTDEAGVPLEWEIRALTTRQDEEIREACTMEVPVKGKPGMYRPELIQTSTSPGCWWNQSWSRTCIMRSCRIPMA